MHTLYLSLLVAFAIAIAGQPESRPDFYHSFAGGFSFDDDPFVHNSGGGRNPGHHRSSPTAAAAAAFNTILSPPASPPIFDDPYMPSKHNGISKRSVNYRNQLFLHTYVHS